MGAIGEALQIWPHSLKSINLSNCHLTDKGVTALAYALDKSYGMSLSLEELVLSGNNLGQAGTAVLEAWGSNVKSYANLKKLHLANTNLVLTSFPALKVLSKLVDIDLSGIILFPVEKANDV
jgi:Ran GTPase-activating protein (RanGAP) involved in mRNA processing and transport